MKARGLILLLLILAALFGDFLSPVPASELDTAQVFSPPSKMYFVDAQNRFHIIPIYHQLQLADPIELKYVEDFSAPAHVRFFAAGYRYRLFGLIPASLHLAGGEGFHPLGTDDLGRDVLARLLRGARTSLFVVLAGVCLYAVLGLAVGGAAAVSGGWIDALLMRWCEVMLALPALYLILAVRASLPLQLPYAETLILTAATIAGVAWPNMARTVRGSVRQILRADFIEAAFAMGCTRSFIFRRHLLPALPSLVFSQMAVAAPLFLLGEMSLSFLNMGFGDQGDSWGAMLRGLTDSRVITDFWWNLSPLLCVFATLVCFSLPAGRNSAPQTTRI